MTSDAVTAAHARLLASVVAARAAVYDGLCCCATLCDAVPHEGDTVYRAVDIRLARVDLALDEMQELLRQERENG